MRRPGSARSGGRNVQPVFSAAEKFWGRRGGGKKKSNWGGALCRRAAARGPAPRRGTCRVGTQRPHMLCGSGECSASGGVAVSASTWPRKMRRPASPLNRTDRAVGYSVPLAPMGRVGWANAAPAVGSR